MRNIPAAMRSRMRMIIGPAARSIANQSALVSAGVLLN
jgi:hypothetical protein